MSCDCIDRINEQLKPKGLTLSLALTYRGNKFTTAIPIATEQLLPVKRKKETPSVYASFCPWCGSQCVEFTPEELRENLVSAREISSGPSLNSEGSQS